MKNAVRIRKAVLLVLYLIMIIVVSISIVDSYFYRLRDGRLLGTVVFRYFTNDSNILCAITCLLLVPQTIRDLVRGRAGISRMGLILRYMATTAVSLTMMTVLVFLGPLFTYRAMFAGYDLFLHLIGPLLSVVAFLFLETDEVLPWRYVCISVLSMVLYGIVYVRQAIFLPVEQGGWGDFYYFTGGGWSWQSVYVLMLAATFLLGFILLAVHNRVARHAEFIHK